MRRLWSLLLCCTALAVAAGMCAPSAGAQVRYAWQLARPGTGVAVQAVALDARGMVVVGTSRGLYRYDGILFDPIALGPGPNGSVSRLETGPDSALWAVMAPGGIVRVAADGAVRRLPFPPGLEREGYRLNVGGRRLRPDRQGVWASIARTLWHYDLATGRWEDRSLPAPQRVRSFALRGDTLWLSDSVRVGYSLLDARRRPGAPRWLADEQPGFAVVEAHPQGGAWAVRPGGVYRLTATPGSGVLRAQRVSAPGLGAAWFSLHPFAAPDGSLFTNLSSPDGPGMRMQRYAPDGRLVLDEPNANLFAFGTLLIDRENGLWAVTGEGLAHLDRPGLRLFTLLDEQAREAEAFAVHPRRAGTWISTYHGLFFSAPDRLPVRTGTRAEGFAVLYVDAAGDAYGTVVPAGTFFHADARTGRAQTVAAVPVLRRRDGSVLENRQGGLYLRRGAALQRLSETPLAGAAAETSGPGVPSLTWYSAQDQMQALVGDSLASACRRCAPPWVRDVLQRIERFQINRFVADPQGRLWIAHRDGFERFDAPADGRAAGRPVQHHFDLGDGEVGSGEALSVSPDGQRLWVGTDHGLLGYRLRATMDTLGAPLFRLSRRFALGGEAVSDVQEDEDGRLWVTVSPGRVHVVDWRTLQPDPSPAVQATEVLRNNVPVSSLAAPIRPEPVRLEAGRDGMRLRFWPATYVDAARVRLEYRLAGLDTAWTDLGLDRTLRFGSLPRGRFRLEVRAVREGLAPGPAFVLPLVSTPPFYRTPAFGLLALALSALVSGGLVYLVQARRLAVERLRLGFARDLHDDLGSGLAQISVLSELLGRRADAEAAPWAARVGEEARSLTARMRDLVWTLRPGDPDADALGDRLRAEASTLLGATDLAFEMHAVPEPSTSVFSAEALSPEVRRALLLAFREMLTNVVRHAHASRVTVRYRLGPRRATLVVEDDGVGFVPPTAPHRGATDPTRGAGVGLCGLAERAEALGGRFVATSRPGAGTTATFEVPLSTGFWPGRRKTTRSGETDGRRGG